MQSSAKIAEGAAIAAALHMTVDEFLDQGAAFGIQAKRARVGKRRTDEPCDEWEDVARLLYFEVCITALIPCRPSAKHLQ